MTSNDGQQAVVEWAKLSEDPDFAVRTAEHLIDDLLFILAVADQQPALRPGLTAVIRQLRRELTGHLQAWREEAAADEELLRAWE